MDDRADGRLWKVGAFTDIPTGGNPAGVWIGDSLPDASTMLEIAADVGFSETAFVAPATGARRSIRYYSPKAEVSFCGHATIATGAVLGDTDGPGSYVLDTAVGEVSLEVSNDDDSSRSALTSVDTEQTEAPNELVGNVLDALGWSVDDLDTSIPPARAFAGAWHLVLAVAERSRLADLDYEFDRLLELMGADGLTTVQLVWREDATNFWSRNPFPVGGIVEDPATGAAAAALGGYLRDSGIVSAPTELVIHQGHDMGRPSRLDVSIPQAGGIVVAGRSVPLPD